MRRMKAWIRLNLLPILSVLFLVLGSACASKKPYYMPDGDENSKAEGAAYTSEGMHFRKPIPYRPNPHPWEFYYKHCSQTRSEGAHVSKTAYQCSEPF